jgi:hypothetical protein
MGHARIEGEALHRAREQTQPCDAGCFGTALEQTLQPEADAKERNALRQTPGRMILGAVRSPSASRTSAYSAPMASNVFCTERRFPAP